MQQYLWIFVLLIFCGVVGTVEYIILKKREAESGTLKECLRKYGFYTFSMIFASLFCVLSVTKYFLGDRKETIFESFWGAESITIMHYSIPSIILALVVPVVLFYLFRKYEWRVIRFFDSALFLSITFVWFCAREMNNTAFTVAFIIAVLLTLIAVIYLKRNEIICVSDKDIKKQLFRLLPFIVYWGILVTFYIPNELYLTNTSDFPMSYWYFFRQLLLGCVITLFVIFVGMVIYLTERQADIFCTLLFAALTMGYIQKMFLNGNMGALDGSQQIWDKTKIVGNIGIWLIFIDAVCAFYLWKKEKAVKLMRTLSIWLALTQIVSLGTLIVTSNGTAEKSELLLTTVGMLEVGEENNIIVFALDKFDGRRMDEILEEDPTFLEPLRDFTYYTNATSEFMPTENSIPYLLTGSSFDENATEEYVTYAYTEDSLIVDMKKKGYDIGIYTDEKFVHSDMKDIVSNYKDGVERHCDMWDLMSLMTQCSRYGMAPFGAKNYYIYDTSDIRLLTVDDRISNIEDDLPFYHRLIDKGLYVSDDQERNGTFRFIHMHGAHPPYTMSENFQYFEYDWRRDVEYGASGVSQAKGALKIVYEYLAQLKALGKYDGATIIITADHGYTDELKDANGNMKEISFPILFVKEPFETKEQILINEAQVCHGDLHPTIRSIVGLQVEEKLINEFTMEDKRIRFTRVDWGKGEFEKYQINGNVRDIGNWEFMYGVVKDE